MKVDVYWLSREIKKKSGKTYKELTSGKEDAAGSVSSDKQQDCGVGYYRSSWIRQYKLFL